MLLDRLFRPRPAHGAGRALYAARGRRRPRTPALYADLGAPDTVEGRFEIYSLHVVLLLRPADAARASQAAEASQALFDTYVQAPRQRPARDGRRRPVGRQEDAQAGRGLLRPGQVL